MAFHVKDEATDKAVRRLAKLKRKTLTATIREAVEHEYERVRSEIPLIERSPRKSGAVRFWRSNGTAEDGIPQLSAWATALPMRAPASSTHRCCSKATISR